MAVGEINQKLSDISYQKLVTLIREGTWPAETRLPSENEMASQFGVSRPVVRQALARLRDEGLITSRRGSGSFVTGEPRVEVQYPAIESIADLEPFTSFREGIEGEAAALAAGRCSADQLETLRALSVSSGNFPSDEGAGRDFDFHLTVAQASGNPFYANTLLSLRPQITLCINLTWKLASRNNDFCLTVDEQHRNIVDAIAAKDADQARSAMRHHVRWAHSRLMGG